MHSIEGKTSRTNLLQGTQPELTEMARELADFLDVALDDHRIGREAFVAISRRETVGLVLVLIVGVIFLIGAAYFAAISLRLQQPVARNKTVLVLGGLGICFTTLAILVLRRTRREIRRRANIWNK